jgi:hypothetical protein
VSDPFAQLRTATTQLEDSAALLCARVVRRLRARRAAAGLVSTGAQPAGLPRLSSVRTGVWRALSALARLWRTPGARTVPERSGRRARGQ